MAIELNQIGTFATGIFDESAAEVLAFDPVSQRIFVVNGASNGIDVLDLSDPTNPSLIDTIDVSPSGGPNSVAVANGVVAIALENVTASETGTVTFFDAADLNLLNVIGVGVSPDALTFTPDGTKLVVANEGEPVGEDDLIEIDPEGSISIIDLSNGIDEATVATADFSAFNGTENDLRGDGVRIFPGRTAAQDIEPEFVSVAPDSRTAFITLQENNAVAVVDLETAEVVEILPLGSVDFNEEGNGLDPSNRDGAININNFPAFGLFQPDSIASFAANGETFFITANEGDGRDSFDDLTDIDRVGDLELDPEAFPDASMLQQEENLGRLEVSTIDGDIDGDGDFDQLFAFGSRSFSIRDEEGNLVFDSGDQLEQITAEAFPDDFNSNNDDNDSFDSRSDDGGPQPEGLAVGVVGNRTYAFIGLERIGGVAVFDVSDPANSEFVQYINNRDFSVDVELPDGTSNPAAGDLGPEGLLFIPAEDSPNSSPLLVVGNEVSGTTTVFQVEPSINTINGSSSNDTLHGSSSADIINGLMGNDLIFGKDGNDTLFGNIGDDSLVGNSGDDLLRGGSGNDSLSGNLGDDLLFGNSGDDSLKGGSGNDSLFGNLDNDSLIGNSGDDRLGGGSGNDSLSGNLGDDSLTGGAGNDVLRGNDGNDTLFGNLGDDLLLGKAGNDTLAGGIGNDTLEGGTSNDSLDGGSGNDSLSGNEDNDTLRGRLGDDTLSGGEGNDLLAGGGGRDSLLGDAGDDLLIGRGGNDTLEGGPGNDTLEGGTSNDRLDGGSGNDSLSGNEDNDTLQGRLGDDTLSGGEGNDLLAGGGGRDSLRGDANNDMLFGRGGNDTLEGGTGNDTLEGGSGNDSLSGNEDNDSLDGGSGNDFLDGGNGNNILVGGAGDDTLIGGNGFDTFIVRDFTGIDVIDGGAGGFNTIRFEPTDGRNLTVFVERGTVGDLMSGGQFFENIEFFSTGNGNDRLFGDENNSGLTGGAGNDTIRGGAGRDTLGGGDGNDILGGDDGNDILLGDAGNDILEGDAGNDALLGDVGNDILLGDAGNDTLIGEAGDDILVGGSGADTFFFDGNLFDTQLDTDTIQDFQAEDFLDFTGYLAAGGSIDATRVSTDLLLINLSGEDMINVFGQQSAIDEALLQLEA